MLCCEVWSVVYVEKLLANPNPSSSKTQKRQHAKSKMAFWRPGNALPGGVDDSAQASGEARDLPKDAELPSVMFNPLHRLPLSAQRQRLPVFAHRTEILYAVEKYATTILVGATGSGKTTQVPQYLLEAGWATASSSSSRSGGRRRMIVCTQPRRIAAMTIAERVAQEVGTPLGKEVGFAVRFEENWDPEVTKLKFCTDGMLLRETMLDPLLSRYSVIMLVRLTYYCHYLWLFKLLLYRGWYAN